MVRRTQRLRPQPTTVLRSYTNTYAISNTPPNSPFYYKFFIAANGDATRGMAGKPSPTVR